MDATQRGMASATQAGPTERWLDLRFGLAALAGALVVGVVIGIPTDLLPNPYFTRMIAAEPVNYGWWIATSVLVGPLLATYLLPGRERFGSISIGSGVLGTLAAGCPVCNKLVVALLGVSGALEYFAPLQPILGAAGVVGAAAALYVRLSSAKRACQLAPAG